MSLQAASNVLALDIGEKRIGVAVANMTARLPRPLTTLPNDNALVAALKTCMKDEAAEVIVVGLPRNLDGNDTAQTAYVRAFVDRLEKELDGTIYLQDEALTSQKAETELRARGQAYEKCDIDALAATYILEDFLREQS